MFFQVVFLILFFFSIFFFKQKTAYELRISDWSSDVCSSDLCGRCGPADRASSRSFRDQTRHRHPRSRAIPTCRDWQQYHAPRTEARRRGKECVSTRSTRWAPSQKKNTLDRQCISMDIRVYYDEN